MRTAEEIFQDKYMIHFSPVTENWKEVCLLAMKQFLWDYQNEMRGQYKEIE